MSQDIKRKRLKRRLKIRPLEVRLINQAQTIASYQSTVRIQGDHIKDLEEALAAALDVIYDVDAHGQRERHPLYQKITEVERDLVWRQ